MPAGYGSAVQLIQLLLEILDLALDGCPTTTPRSELHLDGVVDRLSQLPDLPVVVVQFTLQCFAAMQDLEFVDRLGQLGLREWCPADGQVELVSGLGQLVGDDGRDVARVEHHRRVHHEKVLVLQVHVRDAISGSERSLGGSEVVRLEREAGLDVDRVGEATASHHTDADGALAGCGHILSSLCPNCVAGRFARTRRMWHKIHKSLIYIYH